jgi:hypothetical protein
MPGQVTTTTLNIPEPAIADLRERLARTHLPDQAPGPAWAYGTDLEYIRQLLEYWQTGFDWRAQVGAAQRRDRPGCGRSNGGLTVVIMPDGAYFMKPLVSAIGAALNA